MLSFMLLSLFIFIIGYIYYGKLLYKILGIDPSKTTPAHQYYDGIDKVPTPKIVLLGHHFSSIAGAGPIIGPIVAAIAFGWMPTWVWIILGSIFVGGVHDLVSLFASVRHQSKSIGEIAKNHISIFAYKTFLIFVWFTLVYVIIVFIDLTAISFEQQTDVALSSLFYIFLAILCGLSLYKLKIHISIVTIIFIPLIFISMILAQKINFNFMDINLIVVNINKLDFYKIALFIYCFLASILPVWFLLQPRDYLSSYLLYTAIICGILGLIFGNFSINYNTTLGFYNSHLGSLVPMLFITVACGACSGFHSLVASGTSSKQVSSEKDIIPIGYGSMLIEGFLAVIALSTVMILSYDKNLHTQSPLMIFAQGFGAFVQSIGLSKELGVSFGLLALSTFILTSLDTSTRIARYIFEEFFNIQNPKYRFISTLSVLVLPVVLAFSKFKAQDGTMIPAWKAIWPVFGATNQLLAALVLLIVTVWLIKTKRNFYITLIPMFFMFIMTLWALIILIFQYKFSLVGFISILLFIISLFLILESVKSLKNSLYKN